MPGENVQVYMSGLASSGPRMVARAAPMLSPVERLDGVMVFANLPREELRLCLRELFLS